MASKQTYECYVCRRNGFENVRVYLDRKAEDGKTIFKNPDMSAHIHKQHPSEHSSDNNNHSSSNSSFQNTNSSFVKATNEKVAQKN